MIELYQGNRKRESVQAPWPGRARQSIISMFSWLPQKSGHNLLSSWSNIFNTLRVHRQLNTLCGGFDLKPFERRFITGAKRGNKLEHWYYQFGSSAIQQRMVSIGSYSEISERRRNWRVQITRSIVAWDSLEEILKVTSSTQGSHERRRWL